MIPYDMYGIRSRKSCGNIFAPPRPPPPRDLSGNMFFLFSDGVGGVFGLAAAHGRAQCGGCAVRVRHPAVVQQHPQMVHEGRRDGCAGESGEWLAMSDEK